MAKRGRKEKYGRNWRRAYRKVDGRTRPVFIRRINGKEQVKVPSDGYVRTHHPQGPWDS